MKRNVYWSKYDLHVPVRNVHMTLETLRVTDTDPVTLGWNLSKRYAHLSTLVTMETWFFDKAFCISAPLFKKKNQQLRIPLVSQTWLYMYDICLF